jgi:hypothetical protein
MKRHISEETVLPKLCFPLYYLFIMYVCILWLLVLSIQKLSFNVYIHMYFVFLATSSM